MTTARLPQPLHAVVLAGGGGTRLRPLTDRRPKPLVPLAGEAFAAGLLRRLAAAGADRVSVLAGDDVRPFRVLEAIGKGLGVEVAVVAEPQPLDTAGAVRELVRAGAADNGPLLVCNGDVLTDLDYAALVAAHAEEEAVATLALTRVTDTSSFGVVECRGRRVARFVEKPAPGTTTADTVNAGTYVLERAAFRPFPGNGRLSFERAVFPGLLHAGARLAGVVSDACWHDLGTLERYLAGHRAVLGGHCRWPQAPGFRRTSPTVLVHEQAQVSAAASLSGHVVVGPGARVASGALLDTVAVFSGATVEAGARVVEAVVEEGARIARGAVVGPRAVVA